jgi:hypothetical protein
MTHNFDKEVPADKWNMPWDLGALWIIIDYGFRSTLPILEASRMGSVELQLPAMWMDGATREAYQIRASWHHLDHVQGASLFIRAVFLRDITAWLTVPTWESCPCGGQQRVSVPIW